MSQDLTGGRHFDDFTAARNDVFSGFREAASALKPVEFGGRRLEVLDVGYDATDEDDESERFNYASQAAAVRDKRTLGRRLRGTFRMTDLNTGQVLDEKRSLLATVPRVNEDGTMIYRGARYNVVNQQRLKPGIFGRVKKNQELETFVNSVSGPVGVHRYLFTPASGRFYVNVGNSRIPLTTMLKTLGATDDQIKAAWGEELASKNVSKNESQDLNKLYQKLVPRKLQDPAADKQYKQMAIRQVLDGVKLDKWSVKRLLGVETDKLTPDLILKATAKTLAMSRGDSEGDDRDHLAYQSIHSVEDLLKEYVANDVGFEQRNAMRKVLRNSNLKGLQPKLLQKQIEGVIFGSGLGIQPEYANPLDAWDRATRITKMGFGGIGSTDALPMESRDYHISHQAFLDPARTSECLPPYAELMTKEGWVRADELTEDLELACLLNGRLEYHSPQALNVHDFDGELYGFKSQTTAYEVTGEHRMWSRCCHDGSVFRFELARDLPGKQRLVMCGGHAPYIGSLDAIRRIKSPKYAQAGHQAFKLPTTFAVEDWAEFLGWFVSEGSTGGESYRGGRNSVCISQVKSVNPENWHRIFALLSRMGLKFSVSERAFQICNTHLASYLHRLGTSDKKYIPDEIFEMPVVARQKFLEAALLGDGGYYKNYDSGKRMYFTTSRDLADDMQFLAFGLGYSTKIWVAEDLREERYKDVYVVMLHTRNLRRIGKTKKKEAGYGHYRRQYKGKVYCPTVPGGLIYCRVGDYGGIWMGNSLKVGVDLNVVSQAVKGKDGKLRTPLLNNRTGKIEYLSAEEVVDKKVAFSNKQEVPGYVIVNKSGRESYVKPEEVDYVVPHAESVFSGVANLIPMKMHQPHNRSAMGSRFLTQSLPIKNREQPWVQSAVPGTNKSQSFYRLYSHRVGAIESKVPGKVKSVSEDRIVISTEQGDKVHWLNRRNPLGSKSQLNNTPVVKPGDVVQAGDLLASSNFTDDQGNIAVGLNASVAIMPWGDNYEDAYTISESFAKRMAGLMSYEYESRADGKTNTNKNDFLSALPRQFSRSQLGQIDDDGVVKVGTKLNRGDPILLGMKKKETNLSKKLARSGHLRFMDQSQTWEHDYVGEVTGVHRNKRGDKVVTIEAETPLKAGDKLGALYGSKGVVAILPDDQMVHDKNGKPFDIASSDLGFISRQNSSRALAMMLGKIAQKRGKPYLVEELEEDVDLPKLIREELKAEGLSATETVVDPVSGRQIEGVLTGPEYMLRLAHTAESKSAARGTGAYGQDEQPSKGSGDDMQAKRLSNQELGALVSHGAWEYLRDAALVRGQRNDEYVARFVNGYDLPPPKVPLVYQKFLGYLQGMGVNPVREGSKTKLLLMGDKDVEQLAGDRKLISAETVNLAKNMKPIKGGLFDQAIFGEEGNRFAYFELADPIPHPLMEDVFRNLMGTTKQGFRDILAGRQQLGTHGTGPGAISKWLEQLKPAQELSVALRQAQGASKTKREAALKRIRFLQGMVKQQIDPKDLMLSKVPIIPPKFRPVSKLADKDTPLVDGMNLLYQEMVSADENLRSVRDFSSDVGSERLAVYDAVQAAVGLRQPLSPELRQKQVKGIMARLKGGSPKTSYVQSKLLSGTVDDVGRAVILPNAKLKLDEIGLPEEQAWKIFEMPVLRRLRRNNIPLMEAKELIANRHERARRALLDEMEVRPITASRAPILHKYGKMAFMPKLVKGRSLQVNPLVYAPLGADNDGNCIGYSSRLHIRRKVEGSGLDHRKKELLVVEVESDQRPVLPAKESDMRLTHDKILSVQKDYEYQIIRIGDLAELRGDLIKENRGGKQRVYDLPGGYEILSYDHETNQAKWCGISTVTIDEDHRVVRVRTARKKIIECSDNESLAVWHHGTERLQKTRPEDAVGGLMARITQEPGLGSGDSAGYEFWQGWVHASLVANGWVSSLSGNRKYLGFAHNDDNIRAAVARLFGESYVGGEISIKQYSEVKTESKFASSKKWHCFNEEAANACPALLHPNREFYGTDKDWVEPLEDGSYSDTPKPALHKSARLDLHGSFDLGYWRGFLCGYLENDGSLNVVNKTAGGKQVFACLNTSSPYLVEELKTICRLFNIRFTFSRKKAVGKSHPGYTLTLSGTDIRRLVGGQFFQFVSDDAKKWLKQVKKLPEAKKADSIDIVPFTPQWAEFFQAGGALPIASVETNVETPKLSTLVQAVSTAKQRGYIGRGTAKTLLAIMCEQGYCHELPVFRQIVENDGVHWDKVESVEEKGIETVYDIGVPETLVFADNDGTVIWDTMNFHAIISDEAVAEAKKKMLPSKNLLSPKDFETPMFVPNQDHALGIYLASAKEPRGRPVKFANKQAAMAAFKRGQIAIDTPIEIIGNS